MHFQPMSPRFSAQFVFNQVPSWAKPQIEQWKSIAQMAIVDNKPKAGDMTIEVNHPDAGVRKDLQKVVLGLIDTLGLAAIFKPDQEVAREKVQESAKNLQKALDALFQQSGPLQPNIQPPTVRVNGSHLEIMVQSYEAQRMADDAFQALTTQRLIASKPVQTGSFSYSQSHFEDHPVGIIADPDSEYGQQMMKRMLD